jgi:hypothetical protein
MEQHSSICSCPQCLVTRKEINDAVAPGITIPCDISPPKNGCGQACIRPATMVLHGCGACNFLQGRAS